MGKKYELPTLVDLPDTEETPAVESPKVSKEPVFVGIETGYDENGKFYSRPKYE